MGLGASIFTCSRFSGSVRTVAFRPAKQGINGGEGIQRLQRSFRWTVAARETGVELDDSIFTCRGLSGSIRILFFQAFKTGH